MMERPQLLCGSERTGIGFSKPISFPFKRTLATAEIHERPNLERVIHVLAIK
jgi:hypothetical protein